MKQWCMVAHMISQHAVPLELVLVRFSKGGIITKRGSKSQPAAVGAAAAVAGSKSAPRFSKYFLWMPWGRERKCRFILVDDSHRDGCSFTNSLRVERF